MKCLLLLSAVDPFEKVCFLYRGKGVFLRVNSTLLPSASYTSNIWSFCLLIIFVFIHVPWGLLYAVSAPEPHLIEETLVSLLRFNLIFIYEFALCDIFGRDTLSSYCCMQWCKQEGKCFRTDLFVEVILNNEYFPRPKLLAFPAFQ